MTRISIRALLWVVWSVPVTAISTTLYIGVVIPVLVGSQPHLTANISSLVIAASSASVLVPICILPWVALANVFPSLEKSRSVLVITFFIWVCILGEITTVFVFREDPALVHLVPFAFAATAIVSPRFFVHSLSIQSSHEIRH